MNARLCVHNPNRGIITHSQELVVVPEIKVCDDTRVRPTVKDLMLFLRRVVYPKVAVCVAYESNDLLAGRCEGDGVDLRRA